jgi:hypothetical protein
MNTIFWDVTLYIFHPENKASIFLINICELFPEFNVTSQMMNTILYLEFNIQYISLCVCACVCVRVRARACVRVC